MILEDRLMKRKSAGNLRKLHLTQNLIDFSSNDYLGLARSALLSDLVAKEWGLAQGKLGSTGSRLLTGNSAFVQELEKRIADFHGYEAGLLFNCGYMANVGLLSSIAGPNDCLFFDTSVHASIHEGIRLSKARSFPFQHNNLEHLERRLKSCPSQGERFICIESVYSTDGTIAPLAGICRLAHEYGAHLIVDEAHAVGVFGPEGRGLVAEQNLQPYVFAQIVTFGKALGTFGSVVLGNETLKEALVNFAASFIYTTALPFYALAAIKCSYDLFPKLEEERKKLCKLMHMCGRTPIQPVRIKGNVAVRQAALQLQSRGFDVRPLMSPTVQRGHEMLRISLHAFNTEEELTALLELVQ